MRAVAALLHSDSEIVGSWEERGSAADCKASAQAHHAVMNDPNAVLWITTDTGVVLIPVAHIEYLSMEYEL